MKFFRLIILLSLIFVVSCQENEDTVAEQETLEESIKEADTNFGNEGGNDNGGSGDENPNNEPTQIDCDIFKGIIEFSTRKKTQFAGVNTASIRDLDENSIKWSVNGVEVTPLRPQFILLRNHIQQSGDVTVSYEAKSPTCGTLSASKVINFKLQ